MGKWLWMGSGLLVVAAASLFGLGNEEPASLGSEVSMNDDSRPYPVESGPVEERASFFLEGENLDRLAWSLFDREFRNDPVYLAELDSLPAGERSAILAENYQDLLDALAESRGGQHASIQAAGENFIPYLRWLKNRVIEDPRDYLASRGVFHVRARDIDEWTDLFIDAFSDEDHVREALERLDPAVAQALYRELDPAVRGLMEEQRERVFPSVEAKRQTLRALLFDLRDRIASDPVGWLERSRGKE